MHAELLKLGSNYTDIKHENVTLSLVSNFQRALFLILNKEIRIKDLKQSNKLKEEIIKLFKGERHLTKST